MDRKLTNSEIKKLVDFRHPNDSSALRTLMIKHLKNIEISLSHLTPEEIEEIK